MGDRARVLGSEREPARPLRRVVVPPARLDRELRPRRRLAHLRQRDPAAPGVVVRRPGRRALADRPGGPRGALRGGRARARGDAVPVGRHHAQDPPLPRGGGRHRPRLAGGEPRRQLRGVAGRRARGRRRAHRPAHAARDAAQHVPALRRVRRGLQLRREEHARPHVPHARPSRGRRHPHPLRRRRDRAGGWRGRQRGLDRALPRARRRAHRASHRARRGPVPARGRGRPRDPRAPARSAPSCCCAATRTACRASARASARASPPTATS